MKKILLIFFVVCTLTSISQTIDSVLFSKNGKYVLENSIYYTGLNECGFIKYQILYETENNKPLYYVTFLKDSVYFLTYEDDSSYKRKFKAINPYTGKECITFAHIVKSMSLSQYTKEYQLSVYSQKTEDSVICKIDTLKKYYYKRHSNYSELRYNIRVRAFLNDEMIMNDTIETNMPEIYWYCNLYYSIDEKYYFVKGGISYRTEEDEDLNNPGTSVAYCYKDLNKIGILKKNIR